MWRCGGTWRPPPHTHTHTLPVASGEYSSTQQPGPVMSLLCQQSIPAHDLGTYFRNMFSHRGRAASQMLLDVLFRHFTCRCSTGKNCQTSLLKALCLFAAMTKRMTTYIYSKGNNFCGYLGTRGCIERRVPGYNFATRHRPAVEPAVYSPVV